MRFSCGTLVPADDANAVSPNSTRRIRGLVTESSSSVRLTRTRGHSARCRSRIHTCLSEGESVLSPLRDASSSSVARGLLLPSCHAFDDATRPIALMRSGVIHRRIVSRLYLSPLRRSSEDLAAAVPLKVSSQALGCPPVMTPEQAAGSGRSGSTVLPRRPRSQHFRTRFGGLSRSDVDDGPRREVLLPRQ